MRSLDGQAGIRRHIGIHATASAFDWVSASSGSRSIMKLTFVVDSTIWTRMRSWTVEVAYQRRSRLRLGHGPNIRWTRRFISDLHECEVDSACSALDG